MEAGNVCHPPLLELNGPAEYRKHYERNYCRATIYTSDGIRIYFQPQKFGHAFYKNSQGGRGGKDAFDPDRAQRMDWIRITLESAESELYQGWNKDNQSYVKNRRVSVLHEDFVVVIEISMNKKGIIKGNFITCYAADRSINIIRNSPLWDREQCMQSLQKN